MSDITRNQRQHPARRLALTMAAVLLLGAAVGLQSGAPDGLAAPAEAPVSAANVAGCQVFPPDNIWNTRIDSLPVHARSAAWVSSIGNGVGLKADFGSGLWEGHPIGIPYTTVPGSQPTVTVAFGPEAQGENDLGPYRIPPNAPIEGGSDHSCSTPASSRTPAGRRTPGRSLI
jgi:hypothetical protein